MAHSLGNFKKISKAMTHYLYNSDVWYHSRSIRNVHAGIATSEGSFS